MRQRFKKRKRFKRKVEASRMQRIQIKLSGTMYMFVIPDKSDPIEKSQVLVQLPSSERLKPSYVHRYRVISYMYTKPGFCFCSFLFVFDVLPLRWTVLCLWVSFTVLLICLQLRYDRQLFCIRGAAGEDQPAQVLVSLELQRSHIHGLLWAQRQHGGRQGTGIKEGPWNPVCSWMLELQTPAISEYNLY